MSPEQIRGSTIDALSDIFSFGIVLYELLAGQRPFQGESAPHLMTAILDQEPPELNDRVAVPLRQIVFRCLAKDREHRFQSARDLAFALRSAAIFSENASRGAVVTEAPPPAPKIRLAYAFAGAGAVAGALLMLGLAPREEISGARLKVRMLASHEEGWPDYPRLSPDGKAVAYLRQKGQVEQLVVRSVDSGEPSVLVDGLPRSGTKLFWAPDGTRIFFGSRGTLRQVSVSGGASSTVLSTTGAGFAILPDGSGMVIAKRLEEDPARAAFWLSSPIGAEPRRVDSADTIRTPAIGDLEFSPDGRKLAHANPGAVTVTEWPEGKSRTWSIQLARSPQWFPDGRHLLVAGRRNLTALDTESGSQRTLAAGAFRFRTVSLGRDSGRIAYNFGPDSQNIEEFSMDGKPIRPLTATAYTEQSPAWTADGNGLVFRRYLGRGDLMDPTTALILQADRDRTSRVITTLPPLGVLVPMKPSPDGRRLAYVYDNALWVISMTGGIPVQIVPSPGRVSPGYGLAWSPDGSLIAYRWLDDIYKVSSTGGVPPVRVIATGGEGTELFWLPSGIHAQDARKTFRVTPDGKRTDIGDRIGRLTGASPDGRLLYEFEERERRLITRDALTGAVIRAVTLDTDAEIRSIDVHPDGKRLAVYVNRNAYDLFLMEGFPQPTTGFERLFRKWKEPE